MVCLVLFSAAPTLETFSRGATKRRRAIYCLDTPFMTFSRRIVVSSCFAATAYLSPGNICRGQSVSPAGGAHRQFETRAQLDSLANAAEKAHRTGEAWLLRTRLEKGDFQEGDRIWVAVEGANIFVKPET